ncbi:MAG: 30S ribosomal protein S6 [Ignavibacteriaceae bacterium]|nr:30S ribosomal protein S6 [Ignavibacteriaceae bacterium]
MKKNIYDSTVLINAALDDTQIEAIITRIKEFISSNEGEIREFENWGRKRLAYTINKSKIGYYAVFRFEALSNIVSKLDRLYALDEHILRFLTLKLGKEALEQIDKNKSQSVLVEEVNNTQVGNNNTTESVGSKIEDNDKK